jgi:uncharacterized protein YcfJ
MNPKFSSSLFVLCAVIAVGCGTPSSRTYDDNDFRRRAGETLYEAPVTSVRAVLGPDEQRCWVERERVSATAPTVGGAVAGAIVGGIIGHQIGSGRGNDVATVGGAVAGGAVGASAGRRIAYRDVQKCEAVDNASVQYWDVGYTFRGVDHFVQMTSPPGRTVTVNGDGVPRA